MSGPLLELDDLSVSFETEGHVAQALEDVSFSVPAGGRLAVVGQTGSGKTILALSVLGLTAGLGARVTGSIRFAGREIVGIDEGQLRALRGDEIAIVSRESSRALDPLFRVGAQLGESILAHREISAAAARDRAIDVLELVGIPDPHRQVDRFPHELTADVRRRASIAIAIANEPQLLLADDPTAALDPSARSELLELLKALGSRLGMAIVVLTADLAVAAELADETYVLHAGQIVEGGPTRSILESPRTVYTGGLVKATQLLRGRGEPFGGRSEPPEGGQPLLEVRDLVKRYGTARRIRFGRATPLVTPVDDVSFDLRAGEAFAIVGESGSGKSTLAKLLARLLEPTSGQIGFAGERRELQIVPQDSGSLLNPQRRVGATIAEPLVTQGVLGGEDERRRRVRALLELVGVDSQSAEHFPHELSAAQRRRVAIARAVALEPKLLILDAPLAGLDVFSQAHMLELLHRIRPAGVALIVTGREAEGVRQICDRVAVLQDGKLVESG